MGLEYLCLAWEAWRLMEYDLEANDDRTGSRAFTNSVRCVRPLDLGHGVTTLTAKDLVTVGKEDRSYM